MSETAIKQKASAWSIPGMAYRKDILEGLILEQICDAFGVTKEDLLSGKRHRHIMNGLHMWRYFLRKVKDTEASHCPKHTLYVVGQMTICDHATVLHSSRTAQNLIDTDKGYRDKYEAILSKLPGRLILK